MRFLLIAAVIFLNISCTTLSNRRDLYTPEWEEEPAGHTVVVTTTTTTDKSNLPKPSWRAPTSRPITPDEEPVLPPP